MPTHLSVNLNAVALLRNRRNLPWPDVRELGRIALEAGASGLTVHPRPDERHTRVSDCYDLKKLLEKYPNKELNLEGFPDDRFLDLVMDICPDQVTLVPDDPMQETSDHGWDVRAHVDQLTNIIAKLQSKAMRVSLFIDPDEEQPSQAKAVGADRVEIYTGPYGHADKAEIRKAELEKIVLTARAAKKAGLGLNAGHDLTLDNLPPLVVNIPWLDEVSIGHGLTADCLIYGMADTVRRYRKACGQKIE
jgi:pyridoxine 5-phosphate synthase